MFLTSTDITRIRVELDAERKRNLYQKMISKYSFDGSGKMNKDQMHKLLIDVASSIPDCEPPTHEELAFVMKSADFKGSLFGFADGYLDVKELERACIIWKMYSNYRERLDVIFEQYDTSRRGVLDKVELQAYLEGLSGGMIVTSRQVERVLKIANLSKTGLLTKIEVMRATEWWNKHLQKKGAAGLTRVRRCIESGCFRI